MRGREAEGAEALVRERLRSIIAAAAPQTGWVPPRIDQSAAPVAAPAAPPVMVGWQPIETTWPDSGHSSENAESFPSGDVSEGTTEDSSWPPGRHRDSDSAPRRIRWDPGRPGALALCVVAVLAATLAAGLTWLTRPTPLTVDEASSGQALAAARAATGDGASSTGEGPAGTTSPSDSGSGPVTPLVVSVIGQVHQPGLVSVTSGARVADAIAAAGGALPEADLSSVNLARLVVDGEQIAVGIPGSALPGGADPVDSGGLVNLNTAAQAEFEELPGIGPVLAQRIVDFREDNGGFTAVEQLREVSGIGPTVYEDIVDLVTV